MTDTELILELLLNGFQENEKNTLWTKDKENPSKGYLVYDDGDALNVFIVTVERGRLEAT